MSFTNREEVMEALNLIATAENMKQIEKIVWWIGYLEGYIGEKQLKEMEK